MKVTVIFIFLGYITVYLNFVVADHTAKEDLVIYQKYVEIDKSLKKYVRQGVKYLLPYFMEINEKVNISRNCMKNIFTLSNGIRNLKLWALEFPDAAGKLPDGILTRNTLMLGDYEECIKAKALKRNGDLDFRGQYCLLNYRPILPKRKEKKLLSNEYDQFIHMMKNSSDLLHLLAEAAPLMEVAVSHYGLCVPSGCSVQDINQTANYIGQKFMINVDVMSCQVEGSLPILNKRNIVIICIFSGFALIGVIATVLDYYLKRKHSKPTNSCTCGAIYCPVTILIGTYNNVLEKILLSFSITSNFQKIMNTKSQEESLTCLNGIRVLTLFWILLCHQYLLSSLINFMRNLGKEFEDFIQSFFSQIIMNQLFAVDLFFLMGGLVHSYIRIKKNNADDHYFKESRFTFIKIIFLRIWRLAPSYVFVTLTMFLLVPRGPASILVYQKDVENCEKYWWRNVLFIQNLFRQENMCLPHSWYVAVDMQLFLISLIPVAIIVRNPKKGVIVNSALIMASIVVTLIWSYLKNIPPSVVMHGASEEMIQKFTAVYILPISHSPSYFAGVIIGYILSRKEKIKLKPIYQFIGWIIAATSFTSLLFVSQKWNSGTPYYRLESALFFSAAKFVQTLAIGWIIICCATGNGGIINYILSMKLWMPISRLSYTFYLVSFVIQSFYTSSLKHPTYYNETLIIWRHFGDIVVCGLISLAINLVFDSPFIALQKQIMEKKLNNNEMPKNHEETVVNGVVKTEMSTQNVLEKNEKMVSKF